MLYKTLAKEGLKWSTIIIWVFAFRMFGVEYDFANKIKPTLVGQIMILSLPLALLYLIVFEKISKRSHDNDLLHE